MNMSRVAIALLVAAVALPAQAVVVGFTGPYAPGLFTPTFTGNLGSDGGGIFESASEVIVTGGDRASPNPAQSTPACTNATAGVAGSCEADLVTTTIESPFSFDWDFASSDARGAADDLFGVLIDGVRMQLSDSTGAAMQGGHAAFAAGTSFGWYVNCTDCIDGEAVATITDFVAGASRSALPEPATLAMLAIGGLAAGRLRRGRRVSRI